MTDDVEPLLARLETVAKRRQHEDTYSREHEDIRAAILLIRKARSVRNQVSLGHSEWDKASLG